MISLRDVVMGFGFRDPLAEVWRRSLRGGGGGAAEITGVPPLRYIGDGRPLTDYMLYGNALQDGTPSPDAPVDATGCGVRTGNLWDEDYTDISVSIKYVPVYVGEGSFTLSTTTPYDSSVANLFLLSGNVQTGASTSANGSWLNHKVTTQSDGGYITVAYRHYSSTTSPAECKTMLNLGSTALPYKPYGYEIPPTVNGVEYPIYLGEVETTRRVKKLVLTGEETFINYTFSGTRGVYVSNVLETKYARDYGMCTHYPVSTSPTPNSLWIGVNDTRLYFVGIRDALSVDDANDVKRWVAAQYAAGTPVTVWYVLAEPETAIVNEPLMKIGDYADTVSFAQAGVTIPTVSGENVLDVPTEVKPSEVTIKGGISSV